MIVSELKSTNNLYMLVPTDLINVSTGWTYYLPASQLTRGCEMYRDNDECTYATIVQVDTTFLVVEWQLPSDHGGVRKGQSTYLQVSYVASAERKHFINNECIWFKKSETSF